MDDVSPKWETNIQLPRHLPNKRVTYFSHSMRNIGFTEKSFAIIKDTLGEMHAVFFFSLQFIYKGTSHFANFKYSHRFY